MCLYSRALIDTRTNNGNELPPGAGKQEAEAPGSKHLHFPVGKCHLPIGSFNLLMCEEHSFLKWDRKLLASGIMQWSGMLELKQTI